MEFREDIRRRRIQMLLLTGLAVGAFWKYQNARPATTAEQLALAAEAIKSTKNN
jgi:hypothetical protein